LRYEINLDENTHQHHHLICTECGKIIEVVEDFLDEIERKIETDYDFEIDDHKLKFFGRCSECKK
jgi:Fur family ferric uptake transcriptional regulator